MVFLMEKSTCRHIDCFTFITKYIQTCYTTNYRINNLKSCVIYNGFSWIEGKSRKPKADSSFTALIVGSTVYQKGLDHAESIVKILRRQDVDVSLTAIGFPGRLRVPPENMASYYEKADFLLLPSRCEGFPLTVLEALQHRVPVVVSNACAFDEIPGHEDVGIIMDDFGHNCWADAIRKNMIDLNQYNRLVGNLNKFDLSAFDWSKIAAEYEAILKAGAVKAGESGA